MVQDGTRLGIQYGIHRSGYTGWLTHEGLHMTGLHRVGYAGGCTQEGLQRRGYTAGVA